MLNHNYSNLSTSNSSYDKIFAHEASQISNLLPTYWVSDIEGISIKISMLFPIRSLAEAPTERLPGKHIIMADPDAKEIDIKRVGWLADDCSVYSIDQHIASLWNSLKAFEAWLGDDLEQFKERSFDDWVERKNQERLDPQKRLDPEVAVAVGELAVRLKPKNYRGELETLRQRSRYDSYAWNRTFSDKEIFSDDDDEDEYIKKYLDKVLNEKIPDLDPRQFLPENIAKGLLSFGANQSLPQASLILTFISVFSALHKVGTKVAVAPNALNFKQNPAINHAILGKSGCGKSIITANLIDAPLKALRKADKARFAEEHQNYKAALINWEKTDKSTPQPEAPKPVNKMYLTGWTMEGLKSYLNSTQTYSVLNSVDELAGLFEGFNQYKKGKGNDRQEFLSLYDGRGICEAKVTNPIEIEDSNVAVIGGLQPVKLREYFTLGDSDGLLPRFTFSQLPDVPRYLPDESRRKVDIHELLIGAYKEILNANPETYEINGESYRYFQSVDKKRADEAHSLPDGARKEFLKKCRGLLARIALNLHLIHELADPYNVVGAGRDIPLIRVQQANAIIEYNLKQLETVHRQLEDNAITDVIEAMVTLSRKKQSVGVDGWLTAREINHSYTAKKRMKPAEIRDMMTKAVELGYGQTRGTGSRLEFLAFGDKTGDDWRRLETIGDKTGDNNKNSKTTTNTDLQPLEIKTGDTGDDFLDFSGDSNSPNSGFVFTPNPSPVSPVCSSEEPKTLTQQGVDGDLELSPNPSPVSPVCSSEEPKTLTQQGVDKNLQFVPSLENINYGDFASVSDALKQHWTNRDAVGEIYKNASEEVKQLIDTSDVNSAKAKQYIQECYQALVSQPVDNDDF